MVRHIFRKDWRLLRPLVAALAVLQALVAIARFKSGHFLNGFPGVPLSFLVLLASATLITIAAHQDPIPGAGQDWLVRPIRRRDVFLAKLLFVVALVQGPWFFADVAQGLANGFPLGESAAAAVACAIWILLTVSLPVLAFASLTSTVTETFVAALGVFAVVLGFVIVPGFVGANRPAALTGFSWVTAFIREALLLAAAAAALALQFGWRRTRAARALFAAAVLAGLCASFLPWRTTFRLEQVLAASSRDAQGIAVAFVPERGRFHPAAGQGFDDVVEKPGLGPADAAEENQRRRAEGALTVFFPLRVSGLIADSRLLADRSEVRVIGRDGRTIYQGTGNDLELRGSSEEAAVYQGVRVPGAVYNRVKDDVLDVQLEYSFTLFRARAAYALPARNGDQRMSGIGWCVTKVNDQGTRVQFACVQPGERPSCLSVALEHPPTGRRNPEVSLCAPDYSPFPGHVMPDALSRFVQALPFYDPSGLVTYPVAGPQLSEARVVVTDFRPTGHFVRRVVIPSVRLRDWEPQAP